ncbi:GTP cyclohydrolase II [[Eubacterium] cellulosolvens]
MEPIINEKKATQKKGPSSRTIKSLIKIEKEVSSRMPTRDGEFRINLYQDSHKKEHLALIMGNVEGEDDVLVRIHSECITGDTFGSIRCDCGDQLKQAFQVISEEGTGIIIYLRQEGRGIGLRDKLLSYNLQDKGYDTVEANIALGHRADERDYGIAAHILKDLKIKSIRILTNNPSKLEFLEDRGIKVSSRLSVKPRITQENLAYLETKISRLDHILKMDDLSCTSPERDSIIRYLNRKIQDYDSRGLPFITLTYAQSIDGSLTAKRGQPLILSGRESMILTHELRTKHDAILVGIGTVISDDPQLTNRLVKGKNPQPVILDTHLKFPPNSRLMNNPQKPWIITGDKANEKREKELASAGARIYHLPSKTGKVSIPDLLSFLRNKKIETLMVEGGSRIISSFLQEKKVDLLILTLAPFFIGNGLHSLERRLSKENSKLFSLHDVKYVQLGADLIVCGVPFWKSS